MATNDIEFKRIYDKLEMIDTNMNNGFKKIEGDIEKLEKQVGQHAEKNIKLETLFDSHVSEYKEFKTENEKVHNGLFDKCRKLEDKTIDEKIKSAQSGIFLKIIATVFFTVLPLVGVGLTILGFILKK